MREKMNTCTWRIKYKKEELSRDKWKGGVKTKNQTQMALHVLQH